MKRIVVPMVGGVVTSCVVGLVVFPAVDYVWKGWGLAHGGGKDGEIRETFSGHDQS